MLVCKCVQENKRLFSSEKSPDFRRTEKSDFIPPVRIFAIRGVWGGRECPRNLTAFISSMMPSVYLLLVVRFLASILHHHFLVSFAYGSRTQPPDIPRSVFENSKRFSNTPGWSYYDRREPRRRNDTLTWLISWPDRSRRFMSPTYWGPSRRVECFLSVKSLAGLEDLT